MLSKKWDTSASAPDKRTTENEKGADVDPRPPFFLRDAQCAMAFTTLSTTFFASPNSIMVLSLKNNSFSTPA